jgi:S-methylmethionine-dependent homocysteine/selenocysteine methylase
MVGDATRKLVIMDGSMGVQLSQSGMPEDDLFRQIWSARALTDENLHRMVVDAHRRYIEEGATVLITNAYGVQPTYYRRAFGSDWKARMLQDAELAAKLAVQARTEAGKDGIRVWGCLPPLNESHRPDLFKKLLKEEGEEFIVSTFRALAEAAIRGGADTLILENMVCWEEASAGLKAVSDLGVQIIVSMEGALRNDELQPQPHMAPAGAQSVLAAKRAGSPIEALGFSCTEPELIIEALKAVEAVDGLHGELAAEGIALSAHANVQDRKEAHSKGFDLQELKMEDVKDRADLVDDAFVGYARFCGEFVEHGVTYVGGCCGCGPTGIGSIVRHFQPSNVSNS